VRLAEQEAPGLETVENARERRAPVGEGLVQRGDRTGAGLVQLGEHVGLALRDAEVGRRTELQYVDTLSFGVDDRYVFGSLDQKTFALVFRLDLCIKPNLTLQYYGSCCVGSTGRDRCCTSSGPRPARTARSSPRSSFRGVAWGRSSTHQPTTSSWSSSASGSRCSQRAPELRESWTARPCASAAWLSNAGSLPAWRHLSRERLG
jgi:hypothetical protein